jgi:hypothetical protein
MSNYYEDTSYYCYSVPAHYEDTINYDYSVPTHTVNTPVYYDDDDTSSDPTYYDDRLSDSVYLDNPESYDSNTSPDPIYYDDHLSDSDYLDSTTPVPVYFDDDPEYENDHLQHDLETPSVELYYYGDEIHPAYHDYSVSELDVNQEDVTNINDLSEDQTDPTSDRFDGYEDFPDEKLAQMAQLFEEMLEEMRVWDAEDEENIALEKSMSTGNPPAQSYREFDSFKDLAQSVYRIEIIQKRRTEQDAEVEVEPVCLLVESMPIALLPHHAPISQLNTTKRRECRYHLGPHV